MQKRIRQSLLRALKAMGVFERVRDSRWRQRRLLILCYHSLALTDENEWRPATFLASNRFRERFEMLKQGDYNVLPLAEAFERLRRGDLPARSVVLTFDDGTYDFYKLTYPLLKEYGFPATVYQTTYYCFHPLPVFHLICSYMLWKKRESVLPAKASLGTTQDFRLNSKEAQGAAGREIVAFAERNNFSAEQKNELAAELAVHLGIDYRDVMRQRTLQLMTPSEVAELAQDGISFELHTHRHRVPRDWALFAKEIRDNREALKSITNQSPTHFCYPSGNYEQMFLPWLAELGVVSATTCDPGLASASSQPLLLPRFVDTTGQTELEFESWLTGLGPAVAAGASAAGLRRLSRS